MLSFVHCIYTAPAYLVFRRNYIVQQFDPLLLYELRNQCMIAKKSKLSCRVMIFLLSYTVLPFHWYSDRSIHEDTHFDRILYIQQQLTKVLVVFHEYFEKLSLFPKGFSFPFCNENKTCFTFCIFLLPFTRFHQFLHLVLLQSVLQYWSLDLLLSWQDLSKQRVWNSCFFRKTIYRHIFWLH